MEKFQINCQNLQQKIEKPQVFKLSEVKDKIKKVAFDVVKFIDDDEIAGLWQVQKADDGEYIVAKYEDLPAKKSNDTSWSTIKDASHLHVLYKNFPVAKFSASQLGIEKEDLALACESLIEKLASNEEFKNVLLSQLTTEERQAVAHRFPELGK